MRIIFTTFVLFFSVPLQALTWSEFWEPFVEHSHNYSRIRNRTQTCYQIIRWEEYVPGNEWTRGYVRSRSEKHTIHCPF